MPPPDGRSKLFVPGHKATEEVETLTAVDLLAVMERDHNYAKSELLFAWRNRLGDG